MALFVQAMLCKVKWDYNYYKYIANYSWSHYFREWQTDILYTNTETEARSIEIYLKASIQKHSLAFRVYNNEQEWTAKYSLGTYDASWYTTSWQYTTAVWDFIKLTAYWSTAQTGYDNIEYYIREKFTITQTITTHKSKPRELKAIWEKARSTLYGYHTDGKTWYTGN